jgi:hypothetical protein
VNLVGTHEPEQLANSSCSCSSIDNGIVLAARMYLAPAASREKKKNLRRLPVLVFYHGDMFVVESAFTLPYHDCLNAL